MGGRLQLAVNPELATKSKYIRNKVNLIVCKKEDFARIIDLFVEWRGSALSVESWGDEPVRRMRPLEESKSQHGFPQQSSHYANEIGDRQQVAQASTRRQRELL